MLTTDQILELQREAMALHAEAQARQARYEFQQQMIAAQIRIIAELYGFHLRCFFYQALRSESLEQK